MLRKLRIEYLDALYHVLCRSNNGMLSDNPTVAQEGYRKFMNMEFDNNSLEEFQAIIESETDYSI